MQDPKSNACAVCPFRRTSLKGWLGGMTPEEFVDIAKDAQIPCHNEIDYDRRDWPQQAERAHQCTGQAIFLTNHCKLPSDRNTVRMPADHKDFISNTLQFLEHHNGKNDPPKSRKKK